MLLIQNIRLCLVLSCFSIGAIAQPGQTVALGFHALYEGTPLEAGRYYYSEAQKDSVAFSAIKMYVSVFRLYRDNKMAYEAANSYFLLDLADAASFSRTLSIPKGLAYDEIRFFFGIDAKTNNEGVGSGDLDPSKGMYWAWQTGYINMKLEGVAKSGKAFEFHLGGFLEPYAAWQEVSLKTSSPNPEIAIDIARFMNSISLTETSMVMSPGKKAVMLSQNAAKMFSIL